MPIRSPHPEGPDRYNVNRPHYPTPLRLARFEEEEQQARAESERITAESNKSLHKTREATTAENRRLIHQYITGQRVLNERLSRGEITQATHEQSRQLYSDELDRKIASNMSDFNRVVEAERGILPTEHQKMLERATVAGDIAIGGAAAASLGTMIFNPEPISTVLGTGAAAALGLIAARRAGRDLYEQTVGARRTPAAAGMVETLSDTIFGTNSDRRHNQYVAGGETGEDRLQRARKARLVEAERAEETGATAVSRRVSEITGSILAIGAMARPSAQAIQGVTKAATIGGVSRAASARLRIENLSRANRGQSLLRGEEAHKFALKWAAGAPAKVAGVGSSIAGTAGSFGAAQVQMGFENIGDQTPLEAIGHMAMMGAAFGTGHGLVALADLGPVMAHLSQSGAGAAMFYTQEILMGQPHERALESAAGALLAGFIPATIGGLKKVGTSPKTLREQIQAVRVAHILKRAERNPDIADAPRDHVPPSTRDRYNRTRDEAKDFSQERAEELINEAREIKGGSKDLSNSEKDSAAKLLAGLSIVAENKSLDHGVRSAAERLINEVESVHFNSNATTKANYEGKKSRRDLRNTAWALLDGMGVEPSRIFRRAPGAEPPVAPPTSERGMMKVEPGAKLKVEGEGEVEVIAVRQDGSVIAQNAEGNFVAMTLGQAEASAAAPKPPAPAPPASPPKPPKGKGIPVTLEHPAAPRDPAVERATVERNATMQELAGEVVSYAGSVGRLRRAPDGTYHFDALDGQSTLVEAGEGVTFAREAGIKRAELPAVAHFNLDTQTVVVDGVKYQYKRANVSEKTGATTSVDVVVEGGKPRTLRDPGVVARIEMAKAFAEGEAREQAERAEWGWPPRKDATDAQRVEGAPREESSGAGERDGGGPKPRAKVTRAEVIARERAIRERAERRKADPETAILKGEILEAVNNGEIAAATAREIYRAAGIRNVDMPTGIRELPPPLANRPPGSAAPAPKKARKKKGAAPEEAGEAPKKKGEAPEEKGISVTLKHSKEGEPSQWEPVPAGMRAELGAQEGATFRTTGKTTKTKDGDMSGVEWRNPEGKPQPISVLSQKANRWMEESRARVPGQGEPVIVTETGQAGVVQGRAVKNIGGGKRETTVTVKLNDGTMVEVKESGISLDKPEVARRKEKDQANSGREIEDITAGKLQAAQEGMHRDTAKELAKEMLAETEYSKLTPDQRAGVSETLFNQIKKDALNLLRHRVRDPRAEVGALSLDGNWGPRVNKMIERWKAEGESLAEARTRIRENLKTLAEALRTGEDTTIANLINASGGTVRGLKHLSDLSDAMAEAKAAGNGKLNRRRTVQAMMGIQERLTNIKQGNLEAAEKRRALREILEDIRHDDRITERDFEQITGLIDATGQLDKAIKLTDKMVARVIRRRVTDDRHRMIGSNLQAPDYTPPEGGKKRTKPDPDIDPARVHPRKMSDKFRLGGSGNANLDALTRSMRQPKGEATFTGVKELVEFLRENQMRMDSGEGLFSDTALAEMAGLEGRRLNDVSPESQRLVLDAIGHTHSLWRRSETKRLGDRARTLNDTALATAGELKGPGTEGTLSGSQELPGLRGKARRWSSRLRKTETFFEQMFGSSRPGQAVEGVGNTVFYRNIKDGYADYARVQVGARRAMKEAFESAGFEMSDPALRDWSNEKVRHEVTLESGKTLSLTSAERIDLYNHLTDWSTRKQIIRSGIKTWNETSRPLKISKEDAARFVENMPREEKLVADYMKEFLNGNMATEANGVAEGIWGFSKFINKHYWPRVRAREEGKLAAKFQTNSSVEPHVLESMGITMGRTGADTPIRIRDGIKVFDQHTRDMAAFIGLAEPIRTAREVLQHQEVRDGILNNWGKTRMSDIESFLNDASTLHRVNRGDLNWVVRKIESDFATSVLGMNMSVTGKQILSLPLASTEIGWQYLGPAMAEATAAATAATAAKASGRQLQKNHLWRQVEENVPEFMIRFNDSPVHLVQTRTSQDAARVGRSRKSVADRMMSPIAAMDKVAITAIYRASQRKIAAENPSMSRPDQIAATAKLARLIVDRTQPNFNHIDHSWVGRAGKDNPMIKGMTMFRSQLEQNYQVMARSLARYREGKAGIGSVVNAFGLVMVANAGGAAMISELWSMVHGGPDKADEGFDKKKFTKRWVSGVAGVVPLGSSVSNLLWSYIDGDFFGKQQGIGNVVNDYLDTHVEGVGMAFSGLAEASNALRGEDVDEKKIIKSIESATRAMLLQKGLPQTFWTYPEDLVKWSDTFDRRTEATTKRRVQNEDWER